MTYTIAFLLSILLGLGGIEGGDQAYKSAIANDPGIAIELGLDPNCLDCNQDHVKQQIIELQAKEGGITGDDFSAN